MRTPEHCTIRAEEAQEIAASHIGGPAARQANASRSKRRRMG